MAHIAFIYPLSGIVGNMFEATRMSTAQMGGTISSAALMLGCFFFGFNLLKIYHDIVSDEQHGGFGGIQLWQVLRPIIVLLLISGYSQVVVRPVDSLASWSSSLIATGGDFSDGLAKLKTLLNSDDKKDNKPSEETDDDTAAAVGPIGRFLNDSPVWAVFKKIQNWSKGLLEGTAKACGTIIDTLLIWIFNLFANVVQIFSDVMLNLLVLIGPLMMAFSVLEHWRGYTFTFIGQYVQFSLWKPIVGAICWSVTNVRGMYGNVIAESIEGSSGWNLIPVVLGAIATTAIICFAGIQILKQTPGIANALVSLASGISAPIEGAGGAGAAAAGAAIGAVGGAAKGAFVGAGRGWKAAGLEGALSGGFGGAVNGAFSGGKAALGKVGDAAKKLGL